MTSWWKWRPRFCPLSERRRYWAGVNGTDPFILLEPFLRRLIDLGFSGVQNFPTVGLIDGIFRVNLEETGMGFGLEIDMIRAAHELDMLTTPYVFGEEGARAMTEAGADIIVCHLGLTTGGAIGAGNGSHARRLRQTYRCLVGSGPPACARTSSCCATAGPSRCRRTPPTFCRPVPPAMGSTARRAWSDCRRSQALVEQTRRFKEVGRG